MVEVVESPPFVVFGPEGTVEFYPEKPQHPPTPTIKMTMVHFGLYETHPPDLAYERWHRAVGRIDAARAKFDSGETPYEVAAVLVGPGHLAAHNGACWDFLVTDGLKSEIVAAEVSGFEDGPRGANIDRAEMELAVERQAGDLPAERRLDALAEACEDGPLHLSHEDVGRPD